MAITTTTCKSCGRPVIFAQHERTGKITCLDVESSFEGTWHIIDMIDLDGDNHRTYHHGGPGGHTSHFATCPQADKWRNTSQTKDA